MTRQRQRGSRSKVQPKGRGQSQERGSDDKGKDAISKNQRCEYMHLGKCISGVKRGI